MKKILLTAMILALFVATSAFAQTKGYYWYAIEVVDEFQQTRDDETLTFTVDAGGTIYSDRGDTVQAGLTTTDGTYTFYYNVATATITVADAAGTVSRDITNLTRRIMLCDQTYLMTSAVTMSSTLTIEGNITSAAGVDVTLYGSTTGDYFGLDASDNEIDLIDLDLNFDDDGDCIFGTGNDWVIDSDTATKLDFIPITTDETSAINVGANTAGADLMLYGATTGEYWLWDASADSILPNCGNALFTMTDAEVNQFKVNATGVAAGFAVVVETTDGGVQINADGAANGDITIDAADVLTIITPDPIIVEGDATSTIIYEGTADDHETTVTITDATADNAITFPNDSGSLGFVPTAKTTSAGDSLAIPVTHSLVDKTTGADAEALTLANGENGQVLCLYLIVDGGGTGTLTPATCSGFATVVFADAGDGATFMYVDDTVGWIILGTYGVAAPPVISQ